MSLIDVREKDFCDVGSGRGYLIMEAMRRKAKSITAVDIAAPSLEAVVKLGPVTAILANAENLPFERHFDVMTATDIVEHVLNVANSLVTANWSLKDRGVLAVRVPFRENMIWYSNFYGLPMHYTYLRTFDRRMIVDLLESGGSKVKRVYYDGFLNGRMRLAGLGVRAEGQGDRRSSEAVRAQRCHVHQSEAGSASDASSRNVGCRRESSAS